MVDKLGRAHFFQKTFLLAKIKDVLGMPFLTLNNMDIKFAEKELIWTTYTTIEALSTTRRVQLIDFAKAVLDKNFELFVVNVSSLRLESMTIYLSWETWIALLVTKDGSTEVLP